MIKHSCDICGKQIDRVDLLPGYSQTNIMYRKNGETTYLELCDECLKSVEALLKLRKGLADAD